MVLLFLLILVESLGILVGPFLVDQEQLADDVLY